MGFAYIPLPMEDELLQSIIFRFEDNNMLPKNVFYSNFISNDPVSKARPQNIKIPMGSNLYVPKVAEILNMKPRELFFTNINISRDCSADDGRKTNKSNQSFLQKKQQLVSQSDRYTLSGLY